MKKTLESNLFDTKVTQIPFPVDLAVQKIWSRNKQGSFSTVIGDEKTGATEIKITFQRHEKLDEKDRRIYLAIGALREAGITTFPVTAIYRLAGYKAHANYGQDEQVLNEIERMRLALLEIDTAKDKGREFMFSGPLLPVEVNPKEMTVTVKDELPLLAFAAGRGQLEHIDQKLFEVSGFASETKFSIEHYLIKRILRAVKLPDREIIQKIKMSTVYAELNKSKSWIKKHEDKFAAALQHYIKCGIIKDYTFYQAGDVDGWYIQLDMGQKKLNPKLVKAVEKVKAELAEERPRTFEVLLDKDNYEYYQFQNKQGVDINSLVNAAIRSQWELKAVEV